MIVVVGGMAMVCVAMMTNVVTQRHTIRGVIQREMPSVRVVSGWMVLGIVHSVQRDGGVVYTESQALRTP